MMHAGRDVRRRVVPMIDLRRAHEHARSIATRVLSEDAGPMVLVEAGSHFVYAGSDVIVKVIAADDHSRLDREIALARDLPAGLSAPLLDSGTSTWEREELRYACYRRVPGAAPGIGIPGVDAATAERWAAQAVALLEPMHAWVPTGRAERTLREPLDHGSFLGAAALVAGVERLAAADHDGLLSRDVLDGLVTIAERSPAEASAVVPVHADCHWGNWLVDEGGVVALLDFEWARLGEPIDDWFFLARFSGPHQQAVVGVIAEARSIDPDELRAACERREVSYLTSDLLVAMERTDEPADVAAGIVRDLHDVVVNRSWWRPAE